MRRTLIAIALLALAAPAAARAEWSSPIDLHSGAQFVLSPQAMFAARGDAVVGFGYGLRSSATTFAWTRTIPGGGPRFYGRDTSTTDAGALRSPTPPAACSSSARRTAASRTSCG